MNKITAFKNSLLARLILVVIAFSVMVITSSAVMHHTLNIKLLRNAEATMDDMQTLFSRILSAPEPVLDLIAINIENMYSRGAGEETMSAIKAYIDETSSQSFKSRTKTDYHRVYAYFEANGEFYDGLGWIPHADFNPKERPWYKAAPKSGDIGLSEPFIDAESSRRIISYSRRMFDAAGEFIGVVAVDVFIDSFRDMVISKRITPNSYGYMIDENFHIIMHKNTAREGLRIWESQNATQPFADLIREGKGISFKRSRNYEGVQCVVFGRQIYNDWYFALIIPEREYYAELYSMIAITGILGAALAIALIFILISLEKARRAADEERIKKTLQLTEAEIANKTKSSFLAQMSHEIRTPMNSIMGVTEILMEDEPPHNIANGLGIIYNSCDMLLGIINDILDFSKIEAGKMELNPNTYFIASVINDSVNLNMMRIGSKVIEFDLYVDENLPAKMIGDELRIKQILNNILSNAFKYTSEGSVSLSVSQEKNQRDSQDGVVTLVFKVQDTGGGMTKEQVDKLFGEYTRFNNGKSNKVEGTGLGLAITLSLVKLMDGEIKVDSEFGKGSTFIIRIPQKVDGDDILGREVSENLRNFKMMHIYPGKKMSVIRDAMPYGRVLVVDDVETNLFVAKGLLRPYELNIDTVMSGFEAIEKVKEGNVYDIIFMDHMMPELDGMETTARLRGMGYKEPIVALTANAVTGQSDIFLQNGFDSFIAKPIDLRQLNSVLNKLIRDKQPPEIIEKYRNIATKIINKKYDEPAVPQELLGAKIEGLDIRSGLEKFGGDAEGYLKILRSFSSGVWSMKEKLERATDDINAYKIAVHSIKGMSFDLFANDIGEKAAALENAAKSGDINYINENNKNFMEKLFKFVSDVDALLSTATSNNSGKPTKEKPDAAILSQLVASCKAYHMDGADAAMDEINKYHYTNDDGLAEWLQAQIDVMDFSAIVERLGGGAES